MMLVVDRNIDSDGKEIKALYYTYISENIWDKNVVKHCDRQQDKSLPLLKPLEEALLQVDGWLGRAVTNALLHNVITLVQFGAHLYCFSVQFGAHLYCLCTSCFFWCNLFALVHNSGAF